MYKIKTKYNVAGFAESKIGGRSENQDSMGFSDTPIGLIVTVCDGMGGMNGGKTASEIAVKTIVDDAISAKPGSNPKLVIINAIKHANEAILKAAAESPDLAGMGTTATVLVVNERAAWISHVGDSRVYQLHKGRKVFRTFDDSMVFQYYVKRKAMTEEKARLASNSNVILKALGVSPELEFDVTRVKYRKNDRFILCTDGFWGNMPEAEFLKLVRKKGNLGQILENACEKIEDAGLLEKGNQYDNLTCAIFDCLEDCSLYEKQPAVTLKTKLFSALILLVVVTTISYYSFLNEMTPSNCTVFQTYDLLKVNSADSLETARDYWSTYIDSVRANIVKQQQCPDSLRYHEILDRNTKDAERATKLKNKLEEKINTILTKTN